MAPLHENKEKCRTTNAEVVSMQKKKLSASEKTFDGEIFRYDTFIKGPEDYRRPKEPGFDKKTMGFVHRLRVKITS